MRFAAALSEHPLATHAVGEAIGQVLDQLGEQPDAAVLFVTAPFAGATEDIAATVRTVLAPGALVGCTASGVLCGAHEVESGPAIAIFAMQGVGGATALVATESAAMWDDVPLGATVVVLADPFTSPVADLVEAARLGRPDLTVVGGLASAASGPGGNRLVADRRVLAGGAVALVLPEVAAEPFVSQGADPVGPALVVTGAEGTMVTEIAGQPALDRLMAIVDGSPVETRNRMARGLRIGLVLDERRDEFERGDFLVRQVLGADRDRRSIAIDGEAQVGSTIQFHVVDRASGDQDLRDLLAGAPGDAALAFACTARGAGLFGAPDHDAAILDEHLDHGPLVGMFSAGEIAPVHGQTHLHTNALAALLLSR